METTFRKMTVEHLGQAATQEDLDQFRAVCEQLLDQFGGDEAAVTDYVWNNGNWTTLVEGAP